MPTLVIAPCPVCGCDDEELVTLERVLDLPILVGHDFYVNCEECECSGPGGWGIYEAIKAWNKYAKEKKEENNAQTVSR